MTEIIQGGPRRQRKVMNDEYHRYPREPAHLVLLEAMERKAQMIHFNGIPDIEDILGRIERLSPKEEKVFEQMMFALAKRYDGPGGP